jgi:hypothetical protein
MESKKKKQKNKYDPIFDYGYGPDGSGLGGRVWSYDGRLLMFQPDKKRKEYANKNNI